MHARLSSVRRRLCVDVLHLCSRFLPRRLVLPCPVHVTLCECNLIVLVSMCLVKVSPRPSLHGDEVEGRTHHVPLEVFLLLALKALQVLHHADARIARVFLSHLESLFELCAE